MHPCLLLLGYYTVWLLRGERLTDRVKRGILHGTGLCSYIAMFTHQWVNENFGDARWLGAGGFGEVWQITFEGRQVALKLTKSHAEKFCVNSVESIQPESPEADPLFPLPYIFLSGQIPSCIVYDVDWYEANVDDWSPLESPTFFYIRELAEPVLRPYSQRLLEAHANAIYQAYGLIMMDLGGDNWGFVQRGEERVLVPIDLACGTPEHWREQIDDWGELNTEAPFTAPDWLEL